MKTICIINNKGGVGKSATVYETAASMKLMGFSVLVIDLDEQSSITWQVFGRQKSLELKNTISDVATMNCSIENAILNTPDFDLVPGSPNTRAMDKQLPKPSDMFNLKKQLDNVRNVYDICLIDEPAHLGVCAYLGTFATSDGGGIIIPVEPDITTIQGAILIEDFLEENKIFINNLKILGLLKIKFKNYNFHKEAEKVLLDISKKLNTKIYNTNIRECTALKEARGKKTSVLKYKPNSNAAKDYASFSEELSNQLSLRLSKNI